MSDNINKKFFKGDIDLETETLRDDGKIIISQKGTIQLLDSWVNMYFRPTDDQPIKDMINNFKTIRKLRQEPAHRITDDTFDKSIFHEQRNIINKAYEAAIVGDTDAKKALDDAKDLAQKDIK